jgi:hypothetical protein
MTHVFRQNGALIASTPKSQLPVMESAPETTALMLGTDKSRGYCLWLHANAQRGSREIRPLTSPRLDFPNSRLIFSRISLPI